MRKTSISDALFKALAAENRRIVSDWRFVILLRRATSNIPLADRRWRLKPSNVQEVRPILARLARAGYLEPVPNVSHLYKVIDPYAKSGSPDELELLMEVYPFATVSFHSAFFFHQLTDEFPNELYATIPSDGTLDLLPPGTFRDDWEQIAMVRGRLAGKIGNQKINWHKIKSSRLFGMKEYSKNGFPIRVTDPERTLIDGLLHPVYCGGFGKVLSGWRQYSEFLDIRKVIDYVEKIEINVLKQRVGFILEKLNFPLKYFVHWTETASRGGSSRLHGSAPFSKVFDEKWKLSINTSINPLFEE